MKKILLLSILFVAFFSAGAQSLIYGNENIQAKKSTLESDGTLDVVFENVTVYPNPVIDQLKVSFRSSRKSIAVISIFNNIGKPVFTQNSDIESGSNIISIDVRSKSLEPGIYFIQCVAEKESFTRKLVLK
jgi:hypothetical protein